MPSSDQAGVIFSKWVGVGEVGAVEPGVGEGWGGEGRVGESGVGRGAGYTEISLVKKKKIFPTSCHC